MNGWTSETYEPLHKDYIKKPYRSSNKRDINMQIIGTIKQRIILASLSNTSYDRLQNSNEQFSTLIYSFTFNDYINIQNLMINSNLHY
ncbi:hypothetical protein C2G38_1240865 [Gigaspora rosea]|uniref:Uncharacterized protein n=1 Tax=Gigaspora rosea TaxID=44941 RepID=A0A397VDA6_9GLOM|nr:hypothetical protein C2G38_1240865 [Gigaspora rosea]